jgi:hypothetical protein
MGSPEKWAIDMFSGVLKMLSSCAGRELVLDEGRGGGVDGLAAVRLAARGAVDDPPSVVLLLGINIDGPGRCPRPSLGMVLEVGRIHTRQGEITRRDEKGINSSKDASK